MNNVLKYKGYYAVVQYSAEDEVLYGKIEGINDLVSFESDNISDIKSEFESAVDDYIEYCREIGKEPEKAYKGSFNVRIPTELHKKLAISAISDNITLNQAVQQAIESYLKNKMNEDGATMELDSTSLEATLVSKANKRYKNIIDFTQIKRTEEWKTEEQQIEWT